MGGSSGTSQPTTTTQNLVQSTQLPEWYATYLQDVMGRATAAAGEKYQPYTGPTVAGLSDSFYDSRNLLNNGVQSSGAFIDHAGQQFNNAAAGQSGAAGAGAFGQASDMFGNPLSAGADSFNGATNLFNQGAGANTAGVSNPYIQQGTNYASQAAGGSSVNAANPYIQQSVNPTGLSAAAPYLGAASQTFPGSASAYMSPYNSGVTDRIAELGARNLSENLLPAVSDDFVRAGQYGSTRQRDLVGRAVRDTQDSILGQQAQALEQGYSTAGQLFNADQSRLAGLAGTAGGLGTQQQQILQGAGSAVGNLSSGDLSRLLSSGQTIGQLGLGQAGVAGTDASRQIQAGQGLSGIGQAQNQAYLQGAQGLSNIGQSQIQASQADLARQVQAAQGNAGLGQDYTNNTLRYSAGLDAAGQEQQANTQANYNSQIDAFMRQNNFTWDQIARLSSVVQGLPVNTSSSSSQTNTAPGPSALGQLAGVGLGVAGLGGVFRKAKGGAVRAPKKKNSRASYGVAPSRGLSFYGQSMKAA